MEEIMNNIRTKNIDYSSFSITPIIMNENFLTNIQEEFFTNTTINLTINEWKDASVYRIFNGCGSSNCHTFVIKPGVDIIAHIDMVYGIYNAVIKNRNIHLKGEYENDWKFQGSNLIQCNSDIVNIYTLISIFIQEYGYEQALFTLGTDFKSLFKEDERFKKEQ